MTEISQQIDEKWRRLGLRPGDVQWHEIQRGPDIGGHKTTWHYFRLFEATPRGLAPTRIVGFLYDHQGVWVGSSIQNANFSSDSQLIDPTPPMSVPQIRKVLWGKLERVAAEWQIHHYRVLEEEADYFDEAIDREGNVVPRDAALEASGEITPLAHAWRKYLQALENPTRPTAGRRREVQDLELAQFAELYAQAVEDGEASPVLYVTEVLKLRGHPLSVSTVRSRITAARKAGLLTATERRQAGGQLTEKALRLLGRDK